MPPILEVRDVSKTYGKGLAAVRAVRNASLVASEGDSILVMGPSGSGKTTLLLMCGSLLRPDEGSVTIDGTKTSDIKEPALSDLRLSRIGFIFQQFNLLRGLTALQNVELVLNARGVKGKEAKRVATDAMDQVGLVGRANHLPEDLSGGEKQRVGIARALVNNPRLIIADEPTANLDTSVGSEIIKTLVNGAKQVSGSVLIASHDARIGNFVDRVLRIEDGVLSE